MNSDIKYVITIFSFISCIYTLQANAATITASSVSFSDVQSAVNTARRGDIVVVPAGTATWPTSLLLSKWVILQGAGIDKTLIVNGIIDNGAGDYLIYIRPTTPADNPYIEITGFTFNANSEGGCISINCEDNTYAYSNFRIHNNKLKNTRDSGNSYMSVRVKGDCFGLIDHNQFVDNYYDFKIYGDDQDSWDDFPAKSNMGLANYLYIENNTSTGADYFILTSGEGARWVFRHNTYDINSIGNGNGMIDAHGDTRNDGVVAFEVYENTFTNGYSTNNVVDYRGGAGIIFNNNVDIYEIGWRGQIKVREEYSGCNDSVSGGYIWNNRNTNSGALLEIQESDSYSCIAEDTNWWDDGNDSTPDGTVSTNNESQLNFIYDVAAKRPGTCSDDDCYWETDNQKLYRCDGDNNWILVYSPYNYPHPLSSGRPNIPQVPENLTIAPIKSN